MSTSKGYAYKGELMTVIPKASTQLTSGDYVVMPRNADPISRAVLGAESRISPASSAYACQWGIGIVDSDFNTNTVGATLYATPTASQSIPVIRKGVVRLAIDKTSGQAGDLVIYSSGGTGAQIFTLNNYRSDVAVGRIFNSFSGASANDTQLVELIEKPIAERDIHYWLGNRVLKGCALKPHSTLTAPASSMIQCGVTGEINRFIIKGKVQSMARKTSFKCKAVAPGASDIRFYWVAAHVSTTGAGATWVVRTCTGPFTAIASWTNSVVSAGMMIPITWDSNCIPLGLVIAWSATLYTINENRILNMAGKDIPWGTKVVDHTKWYL